jgi:predicted 2-oxoglutarate/Fe(II)-dependent dioxygenase YbiX
MNQEVKNIIEFLSEEECNSIIKKCLNELDLTDAETYSDNKIVRLNKKETRKSKVAFIDDLGNINNRILLKVMEGVKVKGFEPSIETFQFTKYNEGDYFNWHTDSNETIYKDRFYTIVIQLNEDYTGGDFELMVDNEKHKMEFGMGNLFIFPSNILHRVTPIKMGTRYSLVSWLKLKEIKNHKKTLL